MRHSLSLWSPRPAWRSPPPRWPEAVTPAEIQDRGTVRIGVLTGAPPMGMVDERGKPTGYDVDVANLVASMMVVAGGDSCR